MTYTVYQSAFFVLESFFDVPLSLGDRMILRQLVADRKEENNRISHPGCYSAFDPVDDATMIYINKFYGIKIDDELYDAVRGAVSPEMKSLVRRRALYWE